MPEDLSNYLPAFDPLSEITRKERRALLAASTVAIGTVKLGLIPTKYAAFGIEFTQVQQSSLMVILSLIVAYFLIAFLLYAASDIVAWIMDLRQTKEELDALNANAEREAGRLIENRGKATSTIPERADLVRRVKSELFFKIRAHQTSLSRVRLMIRLVFLRGGFDFCLPIMLAGYAIYLVCTAKLPASAPALGPAGIGVPF